MTRLIVGPFNRVEGDLEVELTLGEGQVVSARVTAPMYRGFEQILRGKHPLDALVYVPRICGICSVSQSVAAARALSQLAGVAPARNGVLASNLILAVENLADHLSHFYLFFMPDFCRDVYREQDWYARARERFMPETGESVRLALQARQRWMTMLGTLAGKWPHTQSIDPGGSSRALDASERMKLQLRVREFRRFLETRLFAAPLEEVSAQTTQSALWSRWCRPDDAGDFGLFLHMAQDLGLQQLGRGPGRYLSYGAYPQPDGGFLVPAGLWREEGHRLDALDLNAITEDATHAWLHQLGAALHPYDGVTLPDPDKLNAYTWNKAPRLADEVVETGALARQLVAGQPLVREAVAATGGTVYTRVLARLIELATVVQSMEFWLTELEPEAPYCQPFTLPANGQAVGLNEAARGSLGHWLRIEDGRIANYQIVAPTSWNFSPRDARGQPGALEQALAGAPVRPGETTPVSVQHIVRSFDPCMVCTVH
ncbi:MAG TPA: HupV protein [Curvibacter sp.]|jgi:hydrogenase large subunit|nr:HupV protein [Curvibacter sp.]